jgi:hypothetical protein
VPAFLGHPRERAGLERRHPAREVRTLDPPEAARLLLEHVREFIG